jgi:hypothetical protein
MLEIERMIALHDPVHQRLRPGGSWSTPDTGPAKHAEWSELEDYMGFFEHCELLLQAGSLQQQSFKAIFRYRIVNIMANKTIVQAKLVKERKYWHLFLELLDRLGIDRPNEAS